MEHPSRPATSIGNDTTRRRNYRCRYPTTSTSTSTSAISTIGRDGRIGISCLDASVPCMMMRSVSRSGRMGAMGGEHMQLFARVDGRGGRQFFDSNSSAVRMYHLRVSTN